MTDRPPQNIEVVLLRKIDELTGAVRLLIHNDVDYNAPNYEYIDSVFDHIDELRYAVERLFTEYRASLAEARQTIVVAYLQAENGTRPFTIPIAVRPLILADVQGQELHSTPAREVIDQVFGSLAARIQWVPAYYIFRGYLSRRPYRNPGAIDRYDDDASLFSDNEDGNE